MTRKFIALRSLALILPFTLVAAPVLSQDKAVENQQTASRSSIDVPAPQALQIDGETPWIYRGSDVPQDEEWLFGEMDNGLRYAVRRNAVPPGQVSIRIRIDAGSLHEEEHELGFAHLLEHMTFRESKYLGPGEAIPTWQRLGATFGSDTNAETSPTHTAYKLDLPDASDAALAESFKLLSGMIREPVLNKRNLAADVPIVLAEKRESSGAGQRAAEATRATLFAGQRLATRSPIGTEETLTGATARKIKAFHRRWYRPQNTVIAVAGDADPMMLAGLVEKWFGDWKGKGRAGVAPDFGDPVAPGGEKIGETAVIVEPDLPRSFVYATMRPWRPVNDTVAYNQGVLRDALAQALINRRLEARARAGGSFLYAAVEQDDVSRSTDATFVSFAPLSDDWQSALADVRGVIADALAEPPTQEELDREVAEFETAFVASVEQARVQAGATLADTIVQAVDIREAVASPQTVLDVFRGMKDTVTPEQILEHTRALFEGSVVRAAYITPEPMATADGIKVALAAPVSADSSARLAASTISFEDQPAIGTPGEIADRRETGLLEIEQVDFTNGVKAILWQNDAEAGRVNVKVRFGAGYRAFSAEDAPYIALGEQALISAGLGDLGQEELDRISTGRMMGFDFGIGPGAFSFAATTRQADLADQLYLFAAKLAMPRWDPNPLERVKAASRIGYESLATSPAGILARDLEYLLNSSDPRFATSDPATLATTDMARFREVWEPILATGPIEVIVFGDFEKEGAIEALRSTFGALPERAPIADDVAARLPSFPQGNATPEVRYHRGDANQAAAVIAWPSGGGVDSLRMSRQLELLTQLFNNRLLDAMRERSGASYSPNVGSRWPVDINGGGRITAVAQLKPEDVSIFFEEATRIARDLALNPPGEDELNRVTEPMRQLISRASTGNTFWMFQLEGATSDPRRYDLVRSILTDYSQTTPEIMQALAARFLNEGAAYRLAVIPEGQELTLRAAEPAQRNDRRSRGAGR